MKQGKVRSATIEQYERIVRLYLKPGLGRHLVKDLNAARIQAHYGQLQADGVGARTIEIVHTVLHGCLKYAHRLGLVTQNWAELVESPRPEKREMKVWSESQVSAFLASVPDQPIWRVAFATGMRRGELIGLRWEDFDSATGALMVRRQIYEPAGGGWRFQEPKTERGRRVIRIGPGIVEALRYQYYETLPLERAISGDRWEENDLIFPSANGGPIRGYTLSKRFKDLVLESGLPEIRLHDIRHTAASIMLLHGEPAVRVAAILGQSVAVLLDTYAHYIQDDQLTASTLMDAITTPVGFELSRTDRAR
jgi:integrase